ncbi:MAG TPA: aminopeptidase [Candidatus Bathyarchaeia archaeon]|nr:aminopeptidase [Candidatus Bathyarchaeia archaeon]
MVDPRIRKLAQVLVDYSVKVKKEDKVLIECSDPDGLPLAKELYKLIFLKRAYPYLLLGTEDLSYFYFKNATKEQLTKKPKIMDFIADWCDKSIRIKAAKNDRDLANIKPERILLRQKAIEKVHDKFLKKPWVVTYWPTESMAQSAEMSLDELEDFYFRSCLQDWQKIGQRLGKIKKIMDNALKVEVVGEKTKLSFSLKGRLAMVCDGRYNMPDGEIFSAPLDGTMNGEIYFDFPTLRLGKEVRDIWLKFKNGKVVSSSASYNKDFLEKSLQLDKGSSKPGEFALGANFGITRFMQNTLFDEKIGGTIHLALGRAYDDKEGGGENKSAIHWDLVKDMRKKGSRVVFDGKVVLKNGKLI